MIVCLLFLNQCKPADSGSIPALPAEERSLDAGKAVEEADSIESDVTLTLADGLEASLWASESLIGDPAGIRFDDRGRVWVASTNRRRTSAPDAGAVSQWFHENLSWTTVGDRQEFLRETLTPDASDEHEWLQDFDGNGVHDWRDMTIEQDPVYRVEDRDGDGIADRSHVLDWDNYSEVTEITGSAFMHDGELFLARIPNILRVSEEEEDGTLGAATSLLYGFGVHYGYSGHGMSGFKLGPDGRLYVAIGDVGLHVEDREGNLWEVPNEGSIFRMDPDGSNFEVVARGLRNVHEFDFDAHGNLIAVDNNGPTGDVDRLVHLIDGSDSGWRIYWQMGKYSDEKNNDYNPWVEEGYYRQSFDGQASHILPSIEPGYRGPAGLVYNPGTALGEEWRDTFFASSFVGSTTQSGIQAFRLRPNGATFKRDTTVTVMRGILSTTLDFGPDGALYSGDWISGWVTKGTGRIWRFDTLERDDQVRDEVEQMIRSDESTWQPEELEVRIGHPDRRIRQKAQQELVKRGELDRLQRVAEESDDLLSGIHAVWGIGQRGRQYGEDVTDRLLPLLNHDSAELRAQVAKTLGEVESEEAVESLREKLSESNPRVLLYAVEALGRLGDRGSIEGIVDVVRNHGDEEIYLERAAAIALARIGDPDPLVELSGDPSRSVRAAALVALRRLNHPGVIRFLQDEDPALVRDAARAINDETQIQNGLEPLSSMLESNSDDEPLLRRAINASFYLGDETGAERLAQFAADSSRDPVLRAEVLEVLAYWVEGSDLDRVTGRYRGIPDHEREVAATTALKEVVESLLGENQSIQVRENALLAIGTLSIELSSDRIFQLLQSDPEASVRLRALQTLAMIDSEELEAALSLALADPDSEVRMAALEQLPRLELEPEARVELLDRMVREGTLREQQAAVRLTGTLDGSEASDRLNRWLARWEEEEWPQELELDLVEAIESDSDIERMERVQTLLQRGESKTDRYRWALHGGRADRGGRVIANHQDAQCYRCHTDGGGAGPDLEGVGSRMNRYGLLEALVDPGATLSPGYGTVTLTLEDGSEVQGFLSDVTDRYWILQRDGEEVEVPSEEIVSKEYGISSMPSMEDVLTRDELRDVVEYLNQQE
ncbi:MAG: HEAT repeat domain-containing protein [Bacteroidota bacterium]